ncbi:MAG: metallophosphoesterase, partial [Myxococcales bacterium]
MPLLLHFSDLHMRADRGTRILDALVAAVARERDARGPPSLLLFTGDIFDSATQPPEQATAAFLALYDRMAEAAEAANIPAVVLPGNHDRRRLGVLGPHRTQLFDLLRERADPSRMFVAGCNRPFLAELVPASFHKLPAHVIAYDSTFLPRGYVGAGGLIRHEDLLHVASLLPSEAKPLPVLFLLHHHLIPTPLTDVAAIDMDGAPLLRWLMRSLLPTVFANADREEVTMTALGAGTALSTLHSFGRAMLVLHGHKHYPTARILPATLTNGGDLIIASAGSAGRSERFFPARHPDAPRLWPSFNAVVFDKDQVTIDAISFAPRHKKRPSTVRPLVHACREGERWRSKPVSLTVTGANGRVELDELVATLKRHSEDRWNLLGERNVRLVEGASLKGYTEFLHALPGARLTMEGTSRVISSPSSLRLDLALDGSTTYCLEGGLCRTQAEGCRAYGPGTAFEWVGLLVRYGARRARLVLQADEGLEFFASVTDLSTGRERPWRLERLGGEAGEAGE